MSEEKKPINYKKYQQGDVVMFQVDDETYKANTRSGDEYVTRFRGQTDAYAILAFGEVTGHKHQVNMKEMLKDVGVTLNMGYNRKSGVDVPEGFIVHNNTVTLKHEEHNPIEIPPGKYLVRIVREFDHIAGRSRYVAD